jgi:tetratricopeptide (TPR) repeat protein
LLLIAGSVSAQNNADKISTLYNEGVKLIGERKFEDARKKMDAAVQLKADYTEAIFARGTCSLMLEEREKACNDFSKASTMGWKPAKEYVERKSSGAAKYLLPEVIVPVTFFLRLEICTVL